MNRVPESCPPGFQERYTVQEGDTMFLIAQQFNVVLQALINANPHITNPDIIFPGDVLCVPEQPLLYTTGPLAIDPAEQSFVGVIIQNQSATEINARIWLINKDFCPKAVADFIEITIPSGCLFQFAFDTWAFFYEVVIEVPRIPEVNLTIYGLSDDFRPIAANTLRHTELKLINTSPQTSTAARTLLAEELSTNQSGWITNF